MYIPPLFAETRIDVLQQCIRDHAFGALITHDAAGLNANHIPFEIDAEPAPFGTLRAHVSRNNPLWREQDPAREALMIFQGPHTYVTPSWYPSRHDGGKVVPTWDYIVVHAYGQLQIREDAAWLHAHVARLTSQHEAGFAQPWQLDSAPAAYIAAQLHGIVGLEIRITRLLGKWKTNQNRPRADQLAVAQALRERGDAPALGIADAIARHNQSRD